MRTIINSIKSKTTSIALVGLVLGAISCKKQTTGVVELGSTPIEIDAQMEAQKPMLASRVNSQGFGPGDRISFYAVKYSDGVANLIGADNNTYIDNKLYERDVDLFRSSDGAGNFSREFFPNDGSSIDIYGVFPYSATKPASFDAHTFTVLANQSASDMSGYYACDMMMAKSIKIAPTATPQRLIFHHMMSKIDLNISLTGFEELVDVSKVSFVNVNSRATINLQAFDPLSPSSAITGSDQPLNIIPMEVATKSGYKRSYTVLLPTQALAKDALVAQIELSTANQDQYSLVMNSALTLNVGMQHTFDIQINFGGRPEISVSPTIEQWTVSSGVGQGSKISDNKFVMSLVNPDAGANGVAWVKVGVNGNRTFTLKASHSPTGGHNGTQAFLFEFPGQGNRPMEYPYTISGFQAFNAAEVAITPKVVIGSPISIIETDRSETIPIALTYDVQSREISR